MNGCSAASIRSADMPALVSAGVTKEQLLAVWSLDGATGFTPKQLHSAGVTVAEMQSAGLTVSEMYTGGVTVADLRTGGVSIGNLRSVGVTIYELHSGGFTIDQMQSAGLTILQIYAGGVSISDLTSSGLTLLQLYNGGISTAQLKEAGVTVRQMLDSGLSILQIHSGGASSADLLREDDLTLAKLRAGGVPDYALFNEVCNTPPRSSGPASIDDGPSVTIRSLTATDTAVVLRGSAIDSIRWVLSGSVISFADSDSVNSTKTVENAIARLLSKEGSFVSTLSFPLGDDVFSSPTPVVEVIDGQATPTSIDLCPCANDDPPSSAMCP